MRQARGKRLFWGIGVLVAGAWACETARNPGGVQRDLIAPTISLSTSSDTQQIASGLSLTVAAGDNLGLKDIRLTYSGGYIAQTDTVFNTTVTSVTIPAKVTFPANSGAGGFITIVGRATDGAGNFTEATLVIFLSNVQALKVYLVAPATGAIASSGKNIPVQVAAAQAGGIQRIGFIITPRSAVTDPTTPPTDSVIYTTSFPDTTDYTDTLTVLATTGTFTVTGFAVDAGGRRAVSGSVTVTVQSAANDLTPPTVSHTIAARVEVSDSITVHATDPSGISWVGFRVDTALNAGPPFTGVVPLKFDSVNVGAGNLTDVVRAMTLGLAGLIGTFPKSVIVTGYACDLAANRNCAYSQTSTVLTSAAPRRTVSRLASASIPGVDTVVVVAGITRPLPFGGTIVDAIFNKNIGQGELYLTNPALSRVEIFQVFDSSFVLAGIPTAGPQPWGIALWPRDTLGAYGDSIVVANSGGTQLAIIDVTPSARLLRWRQDLPNILVETYKVTLSPAPKTEITVYDVSDRPQYVATVCRPNSGGATLCNSDSIYALYSTTPEPSNPAPFTNRATLRMEKLKNTTLVSDMFSHLFWEISNVPPSQTSDTLRIEVVRGRTSQVILSACAGVTVELQSFALGDTTFARNSGNFTHGFFGEGGNISTAFARVMGYTTKDSLKAGASTFRSCNTGGGITDAGNNDVDKGMSPAVNVNDFISNTATKVRSIATNFNGLTNVARADSVYYLNEDLRLKGTSPDSGRATGMDMNYDHKFAPGGTCGPPCGGTGSINDRILFAARFDGNIDVFDTYFGVQIASIPIRDPIIGPLRVAKDLLGNQLLFGITARGLVMLRLPAFTNPLPEAPPRR